MLSLFLSSTSQSCPISCTSYQCGLGKSPRTAGLLRQRWRPNFLIHPLSMKTQMARWRWWRRQTRWLKSPWNPRARGRCLNHPATRNFSWSIWHRVLPFSASHSTTPSLPRPSPALRTSSKPWMMLDGTVPPTCSQPAPFSFCLASSTAISTSSGCFWWRLPCSKWVPWFAGLLPIRLHWLWGEQSLDWARLAFSPGRKSYAPTPCHSRKERYTPAS